MTTKIIEKRTKDLISEKVKERDAHIDYVTGMLRSYLVLNDAIKAELESYSKAIFRLNDQITTLNKVLEK